MASSLAKEARKIAREAQRQGWTVREKKRGRALYPPGRNDVFVMLHKTPSDQRALKNAIARMRRYGFEWEGR